MSLPLAISTLFHNIRNEMILSQVVSGVVGLLLGPGCLLLSFLPVDALPEYRWALAIGGVIITVLLAGLVFETRRKLANVDRILQAFNETPEAIEGIDIITLEDKSGAAEPRKIRVRLQDGTSEILPVLEHDSKALLAYLSAKFAPILQKEIVKRPNRQKYL